MEEPMVVHSTFVIERSYPKPREAVFAAFADGTKKRRWFGGGGTHDAGDFSMDFREGGGERVVSRLGNDTPFPGTELVAEGRYLDIVPNDRIVTASTMTLGGKRISAALATFELLPTEAGTDLVFTYQAAFFEGSDGPERREAGWQRLLDRLDTELASQ